MGALNAGQAEVRSTVQQAKQIAEIGRLRWVIIYRVPMRWRAAKGQMRFRKDIYKEYFIYWRVAARAKPSRAEPSQGNRFAARQAGLPSDAAM